MPRLGEDINSYLQVAPLAHTALGNPRPPVPEMPGSRINLNMNGFAEQAAPRLRTKEELFAPDVSQLDTRNAIQALIQHDIEENPLWRQVRE